MAVASTLFAILNGLSQVAGNAAALPAARENERSLMAQKSELDREYAEGVLEDEGSRAYLRALDRKTRDNIRGIENSSVSTGSTSENRLAQMDRANEVVSNAIGNLLQREEDKKMQLFNTRSRVSGQLANERMRQAQNWVDIANNISSSAAALGESYLDLDEIRDAQESRPEGERSGYVIPSTKAELKERKAELNGKPEDAAKRRIEPILSETEQDILRNRNIESANNQMAGQIMAGDGSQYDDEKRLGDNIAN